MSQKRKAKPASKLQEEMVVKEAIKFWRFDPSLVDIKNIDLINYNQIDRNIRTFTRATLKIRPKNNESPCLLSSNNPYPLNDDSYVKKLIKEVDNYRENIISSVILYPNRMIRLSNIAACEILIQTLQKELKSRK